MRLNCPEPEMSQTIQSVMGGKSRNFYIWMNLPAVCLIPSTCALLTLCSALHLASKYHTEKQSKVGKYQTVGALLVLTVRRVEHVPMLNYFCHSLPAFNTLLPHLENSSIIRPGSINPFTCIYLIIWPDIQGGKEQSMLTSSLCHV